MRIESNQASEARAIPAPPPTATAQRSFHSFVQQQRLGATEARTLLGNAWTSVTGSPAQPQTSALLTAHWALETDSGRCMPGHNFAGIKAAPGAAGKSFLTVEGHGGSRREVNARFRVYESAEAGALDYVRLLTTRYPDAVAAARAGDSAGFARALARGGYFTAAPEAYAAGLSQRLATLEHGTADHGLMAPPAGSLSRTALEGLLRAFRGPANG